MKLYFFSLLDKKPHRYFDTAGVKNGPLSLFKFFRRAFSLRPSEESDPKQQKLIDQLEQIWEALRPDFSNILQFGRRQQADKKG